MTSIAHRPHGGELTSPTPIEEGNQGRGNHIMSEQRPDPIGARTRQRAHGTSAASAIESDREKVTEVERLTRPHPVGSRSAGDRPSNPDLSNGASESVTTARAGARDTTTHEQRRRERRQTPRPRRTPPCRFGRAPRPFLVPKSGWEQSPPPSSSPLAQDEQSQMGMRTNNAQRCRCVFRTTPRVLSSSGTRNACSCETNPPPFFLAGENRGTSQNLNRQAKTKKKIDFRSATSALTD
jgi:hypothetical protein